MKCAATLIPPLCTLVEVDQTQIKFDSVGILSVLYDFATCTQDELTLTLPMPLHLISLRNGLTSILSNKLDSHNRLNVLKLSRLVLQRYGPVFATGYGSSSTHQSQDSKLASESKTSSPSQSQPQQQQRSTPFTQYIQLLSSISTVELRLALHDLTSIHPNDITRVESSFHSIESFAFESIQLFQTYLMYLTGDEDEVPKLLKPYQWWNLDVSILMHLKSQFDLSAEAMLDYCISLHKHSTHPRNPTLVELCVSTLQQWMEDDTETHQLLREKARPFIQTLKTSAMNE